MPARVPQSLTRQIRVSAKIEGHPTGDLAISRGEFLTDDLANASLLLGSEGR